MITFKYSTITARRQNLSVIVVQLAIAYFVCTIFIIDDNKADTEAFRQFQSKSTYNHRSP